ncbi:chitin synthase activator [Fusarium sp. NRRL 52700]|nr:chitin synthase activator [Fusarium sp. NRRL 52700]
MALANDLCRRTQECLFLFQSIPGHRTLADNDWFEDCAADFAWWAHGLKAQKTGRSSLDYRLRERLDVHRVIAGLLDSLALALKGYLQPDKGQESIRDDVDDEASESDKSTSNSSWSELSDEVRQPDDKDAVADTPDTENSDPRFYIETNLKLLAKISVAIRRSGQKLRYLKADAYLRDHLDDEEYTLLRNHLLFLILVGSYEQKLLTELGRLAINQEIPKAVEIVVRSWIVDPSRATSTQQRLIEANVVRRNRIAYARRFIGKNVIPKKPQEDAATTITPSQRPEALLGPAREASTFGTDTKETFSIPNPVQLLPAPQEPTESLTAKTLTATELGSQFILPIIMPLEPKKEALSIVTKITQTGTNQDYPACPGKKGSFQCPYCVQVLSEDYAAKSRWRNQHKRERWACDDCIFESDHDDEFIFDSQESWASHMRYRHSCSEDRLTLLSSMSKRELNELVQCPLCKRACGYSRPDQDDHISEHLHSWALRALPWDLNPDDEASSDSPEMGSENDLARISEISEQTEDDVESVTATTSDAIDREVTYWSQEKPIGSSRLDGLVKKLEEAIAQWTAHPRLDTQNEITLQLLRNINQVKAQFCRASRAELDESELTTQQQHDIEENLCTNIELCMDYMIGEHVTGPSQDPEQWPIFTSFPKVEAENIPPTEEEKEEILWNARRQVLHSKDVSMQITWARDVLAWAQICKEDRAREKKYNDNVRSETPRVEHDLSVDAQNIINYLADQEHPNALYMRAKWLEFGIFGNRLVDKKEAYVGYSRAAALGYSRSEYRCGVMCEQSNDILNAKRHYYRGLALNDSASLYRMGMMSLLGQHGEEKNQITGLERIKASADSPDEDAPQGSYIYGMLIARELPDIIISEDLLPHDPPTAKMYIEKSAYLGFAKAQLKMGQAYELCHLDCNFNPSYSLHYYGLAAARGIPEASLGVSRWFLFGYEDAFAKNESLAYKYAQQAAAGGLATGEFAMGYYNEIGVHVGKNWAEARRWYQLSADHGNDDAVRRLESLDKDEKDAQDRNPETNSLASRFPKVTGVNIPPTDDEKEDMLKRAGDHLSDSDSPEVQLAWACDVLTWTTVAEKARLKVPRSQEVSKNKEKLTAKALAIIRRFSLEDHPKALYHHGKLFEYGRFGHPINLDQAMKLYNRSTVLGHARSWYHLGRIYHRQPEGFEMARPYYEKAEVMGDSAARYQLAFMMIHASHGEEQDYEKGLALLKQSADNADEDAPQGAYAYGMAIAGWLADFDPDESLITTDERQAFSYIKKSADLGYHKAQFQMGQSFHYYHLAVRRGSVEAAEALSSWFYHGAEGLLLPDPELSYKFAQWAAVEGKSGAEYVLGRHYETAKYVDQDLNKAMEWFSSVAWADSSNAYEICSIQDWPHTAAISAPDGQVPTQYDLETRAWGHPRLQAAQLRKSVKESQKSCFSALEDLCSSVEPTCKQAAKFLTSYIGTLWGHAAEEIFIKTESRDLEFVLSLSIPVYFSWETETRLLRAAYDATAQNGASKVVEINVVGQMQAAIVDSLKAQYRLDRSARGPSIVMENGEIVVVCDCGGTGARALSYKVHTESPPLVQQLTTWNGERIGTHSVDMEFLHYLLNHPSLNLGASRSALDELDFFIQTEWEYGLKRTFRGDEIRDINLQLPRKAISALRRLQPSSNKLSINPSVIRKCFEKSLMAIEKVIDAQFAALEAIGRKPNSILLVGGLAQSPYIIQRLQQKFDVMFHRPDDSSAVSRGIIEVEFQRILAQRLPVLAELEDEMGMTSQSSDKA